VLVEDESQPSLNQRFEAEIAVVATGPAAAEAVPGASIATVEPK
jgi:hypothetical protein